MYKKNLLRGGGAFKKLTAIGASSRQLTVESALRGCNHVGVPSRIKRGLVMMRFCYGVVCLEDASDIFTSPVTGKLLNILNMVYTLRFFLFKMQFVS